MEKPAATPAIRPFQVSHRLILSIAVPMTVAYMTTPLLGIVDTAVVGQFGDAAMLGGLATGAVILDLVFASFNFLRAGTSGLVAQAFGAGDDQEEQAVLLRAVAVALSIGLATLLLAPLIIDMGGWFMAAGPDVTHAMALYLGIRILAAPLSLANYALLGYVLGRGEGGTGFALQLLLNGTNIALSFLLGLKLGWGIEGVAWATVIAELAAALCGFILVFLRFRRARRPNLARLVDTTALIRMFAINGDIMIRSFVLLAAFALFTRAGAALGEVPLAANAILMNFFLVAGYMLDGFATAAEQLAGRAIGARYRQAFVQAVRMTAIWGFALAALLSAAACLAGGLMIEAVTPSPDIRAAAVTFLPWAALTAVSGVAAFQMDGVYIGATWSRDMRNMMLLSFAAYAAALALFGNWWGNHGNWAALHLFLIVRGISLYAIYPHRLNRSFADVGASTRTA
ncbi:MAG: MATE family efflux transporter [Rhizobiaceae bacterium]